MMKKIFILLIMVMCSTHGHTQDPELFEHTWYLQKVVVEEEEYPIVDYTFHVATTEFFESGNYVYVYLCDFLNFSAVYLFDSDDTVFDLSQIEENPFPTECEGSNPDLLLFRDFYFSIFYFWDEDEVLIKNPFTYTLETDGENYTLTIENVDGDYAVYGDQQLSTTEFENIDFSVYPNPVSGTLHIVNNENVIKTSIYSITGQQMAVFNDAVKEIDVRQLQNGLYFLVLEKPGGKEQAVKFVKE